jgi:hypothetical protein
MVVNFSHFVTCHHLYHSHLVHIHISFSYEPLSSPLASLEFQLSFILTMADYGNLIDLTS